MTDTLDRSSEPELAALDAYSQVVVSIAEQLTPGWRRCRFPGGAVTGASPLARGPGSSSQTMASYSPMPTWWGGRGRSGCLRRRHHRPVPRGRERPSF